MAVELKKAIINHLGKNVSAVGFAPSDRGVKQKFIFCGNEGGEHSFHHNRIFIRLGRFADQGDIALGFEQRFGQGFKKSFGGLQMFALALGAVFNARKVGVKFFGQLF
jgi:hypothetical protein